MGSADVSFNINEIISYHVAKRKELSMIVHLREEEKCRKKSTKNRRKGRSRKKSRGRQGREQVHNSCPTLDSIAKVDFPTNLLIGKRQNRKNRRGSCRTKLHTEFPYRRGGADIPETLFHTADGYKMKSGDLRGGGPGRGSSRTQVWQFSYCVL